MQSEPTAPDDQDYWESWHERRLGRPNNAAPNDLAHRLGSAIGSDCSARILDLGSGDGVDSLYFASLGHKVVGIDISNTAVLRGRLGAAASPYGNRLEFINWDAARSLPFATNSFDAIYSHLALHYFDTSTTCAVFEELRRVCKPGGLLFVAVKSVRDPLYGKGERLQDDMYRYNGHTRHFYSRTFAEQVLPLWEVLEIAEYAGRYGSEGDPNQFFRIVARNSANPLVGEPEA